MAWELSYGAPSSMTTSLGSRMKVYAVKSIAFLSYWIEPSIGAASRAVSGSKILTLGLPFGDVTTSENLNQLKNGLLWLILQAYAPR